MVKVPATIQRTSAGRWQGHAVFPKKQIHVEAARFGKCKRDLFEAIGAEGADDVLVSTVIFWNDVRSGALIKMLPKLRDKAQSSHQALVYGTAKTVRHLAEYEELSYAEIGEQVGLSRQRVEQILNQVDETEG